MAQLPACSALLRGHKEKQMPEWVLPIVGLYLTSAGIMVSIGVTYGKLRAQINGTGARLKRLEDRHDAEDADRRRALEDDRRRRL